MGIYLFILAFTLLTVSGCSIQLRGHHQDDDNNIKSHLGHLQVGGDKKPANVNSVKGSISLDDHVYAQTIESVSGSIALGRGASVHAVETVTGNIKVERYATVRTDINTVNGDIELKRGTVIKGDIRYQSDDESVKSKHQSDIPTLFIHNASLVEGNIYLYREVELQIENPELRKKVINQWQQKAS
jgi:DUF4097 and DUF4098 domain-containing protein YvlB